MGMGPVTAEDREERKLSDDRTAQILERSRIGTAFFYVPILNPAWKWAVLNFPTHYYGMLIISQNGLTPSRSINAANVTKLKKVMSKNIERAEPQYRMRINMKLADYERAVAHSVDRHAFWSGH